ncbi:MAG: phage tail sheath family protein [Eubacterium sp.]|jgi:hypothetical protein|nr:phage tail sheath family protein [Eubacterium sp.]
MAGGTFDSLAGKVRPGTYINFESTRQDVVGIGERGTVLIPLIGHSYGPAGEFISLTNSAPDAQLSKLGFSVYDNNDQMLLIREAFKNAKTVIVYIPSQGEKAKAESGKLKAVAKYGGSRGNELKVTVAQNLISGFDVTVSLDKKTVSFYEGLLTVEELMAQNDSWIDFSGTGDLEEIIDINLSDGKDGVDSIGDISNFLDKSESIKWNTLAFPLNPEILSEESIAALYEAVVKKIEYLREDAGKYRKAVVANMDNPDYEGIINVTNSVVLADGNKLTPDQVTAWVAGADAGASYTKSNTYVTYSGAVDIVGAKTHEESVAAINKGEFFFSFSEAGEVVVEYDINSLKTFKKPKDKTYRKNRVLRVFDSFAESLMLNFPPNKFDNSPIGWDVMEGLGKAILKQFADTGAIKNADYDKDFLVDRSKSSADETYFNIGLEPIDSAEKLFFTIKTR